ncbi:hypothetical protein PHMEG_00020658 [Phytophthora megakarya]|uniref:Reverse transcriptase/retrotransposon-derived protein RNase H-like domain-containing protein n=1 Tax=Phytophthora megakarya TaxID=4795 RepID=A0A225VPG7_9STRA|nr:hypothetical protein PHMEG_00020658 [Phytophthora megakarya]
MQRGADDVSSDEGGSMDEVVQWNEGLGDELGEESGVVPTAEEVMIATMDVSNSNKLGTTVAETHDLLGDRVSMELPDRGDWSGDDGSPTMSHGVESVSAAEMYELEKTYVCVAQELSTDGNFDNGDDDYVIHEANYILLDDYAHELAFLPDLTEPSITTLDYASPNVKSPELSDVDDHAPIKQKARRISLRFLQKLYELLKGLLKAGLIAFYNSPWASPIVIVLKKNGEDIRLCIDYKIDLLTELESYLWFCSLDAVSGFWAILRSMRARKISAFVCVLGHFEWLRMRLKNAPMIYQIMIDNALWGFVQPQGGWKKFADKTEDEDKLLRRGDYDSRTTDPTAQTKFKADRDWFLEIDPVLRLVHHATADMFATNEPDQSTLVPVFQCFGGTTFDDCLGTLDKLLMRFEECRISVSFKKSIFCQSKVEFLSDEVSPAGIRADVKKMTVITELPFPKSKTGMQQFLGALNYYGRFIQGFALKDEDFKEVGDLSGAKKNFRILQRKLAEAPILRHFDKVLKDAEMNYHSAEKEVRALLLPMKICYTQLAGKKLHVYTRFSTLAWVYKSKSLFGPAVQFAVLLSPWELDVERIKEKDCAFSQLLQSTITNFGGLDDSLTMVASPTRGSPNTRFGFYSAKIEKNGGYGSCSWILWKLPDWQIVIAASTYLETTTVNMAEYTGMNNEVQTALEYSAEDLVIVGVTRSDLEFLMETGICVELGIR